MLLVQRLFKFKLIPTKQIVYLLKHVHLIAAYVRTYFHSTMIQYISYQLCWTVPRKTRSPLHITFTVGYVPTGVFCRLIYSFPRPSQKSWDWCGSWWRMVSNEPVSNFVVDDIHKVTLLLREKSYAVLCCSWRP